MLAALSLLLAFAGAHPVLTFFILWLAVACISNVFQAVFRR